MSDLRCRTHRLAQTHPPLLGHAQSTIDKHQEEHGFSDKTFMWGRGVGSRILFTDSAKATRA